MVKNNRYEPNKCTLTSWVDKSWEIIVQKKIKNGFEVAWIWFLNPKAMHHKTRPFEVYTTTLINILNENNSHNVCTRHTLGGAFQFNTIMNSEKGGWRGRVNDNNNNNNNNNNNRLKDNDGSDDTTNGQE